MSNDEFLILSLPRSQRGSVFIDINQMAGVKEQRTNLGGDIYIRDVPFC